MRGNRCLWALRTHCRVSAMTGAPSCPCRGVVMQRTRRTRHGLHAHVAECVPDRHHRPSVVPPLGQRYDVRRKWCGCLARAHPRGGGGGMWWVICLHMCVCKRVYTHIYMCARMHVCMFVCVYVCIGVCANKHIHLQTHTHTYTYVSCVFVRGHV